MNVTDPIADFLTRIRNAVKAGEKRVDIPASGIKKNIAQILKDQKFITDFEVLADNKQGTVRIVLKYTRGASAITGLRRISKPGLRKYKPVDELPRVLNGYGIAVISTSKGLMTDKQARKESLGGEVLCYIW